MSLIDILELPSSKTPFEEGAAARKAGGTWFDCPYSDFRRRRQWFEGWDSTTTGTARKEAGQ